MHGGVTFRAYNTTCASFGRVMRSFVVCCSRERLRTRRLAGVVVRRRWCGVIIIVNIIMHAATCLPDGNATKHPRRVVMTGKARGCGGAAHAVALRRLRAQDGASTPMVAQMSCIGKSSPTPARRFAHVRVHTRAPAPRPAQGVHARARPFANNNGRTRPDGLSPTYLSLTPTPTSPAHAVCFSQTQQTPRRVNSFVAMSGAPRSRGAAAALAAQKAKEAASSAAASKDRRAGSSGSYPDYAPGEGEAVESPHREQQYAGVGSDADRGDPLFRSGGRGAPAPQPPAPTPAPFTGGFICPPNAIPEEFRDHAEAYEVGYAEGRFSDSTFAQVWEANARWEYNRGAVLKGFLTGRNGRPPPPQTWPRASLDGLATPAVRARQKPILNEAAPACRRRARGPAPARCKTRPH